MIEYDEILNILLEILLENLSASTDNSQVISIGSSKMLEYPEFQDVKKAKQFFALLEQQDLIIKALRTAAKPNTITVTIGNENPWIELQDLSIVTANITIDDKDLGIFGVMGPTRMKYSKAISILEQVTSSLVKSMSSVL
jgi:heat-inducible transcriptional repressor